MRVPRRISIAHVVALCALAFACLTGVARAQQQPPASPADPPQSGQQSQPQSGQQPDSSSPTPPSAPVPSSSSSSNSASASSSSSSSGNKRTHANDFLVLGTVFTDKAYALPGARLRVRRAGEKKFRWETYTNSRGEFAFRVPQGAEYEIVILAKGFADQNESVSAKSGISEDTIVYRMQPASGGKK